MCCAFSQGNRFRYNFAIPLEQSSFAILKIRHPDDMNRYYLAVDTIFYLSRKIKKKFQVFDMLKLHNLIELKIIKWSDNCLGQMIYFLLKIN